MKIWVKHKKKIMAGLSTMSLGLVAAVAGIVYFVTSEDFRILAADNIVRVIQERTGMEATLESFEVDFRAQSFALTGLVMRGNEDASDPPLLSIDRIDVGLRPSALLRRQVDLRSLEVVGPRFRLEIGDNGSTNMTTPPPGPEGESSGFQLFIGDLVVSDGTFSFDEERVNIDFQLADFGGSFDYAGGVLSGHIEYKGAIARQAQEDIPYFLEADFDHTQGTALIEAMSIRSADTQLQLQGRVDDFLRRRLGALEYTGSVDFPFVNYFFPEEEFEGRMEVSGALDFSTVHFATTGTMRSSSLRFNEWTATDVTSDYSYDFPGRVLAAQGFDAALFGGRARGDLALLPLPGDGRVELDVRYEDIDFAKLRSLYPWDSRYLIRSYATGTMAGWFRGAFDDFDLSGDATLRPYMAESAEAIVDLSITGTSAYRGTPDQIELEDLIGFFGSTNVVANGVVRANDFELNATLRSEDLTDLSFVDSRLNGSGEFEGVLRGMLVRPDADGRIALEDFSYAGWTIDRIDGRANVERNNLTLDRVRVVKGSSEVTLDGGIDLSTRRPDLEVEVVHLDPADIDLVISFPIAGSVSGDVHVDSFFPIFASGSLSGVDMEYDGQEIGAVEADVTVKDEDEVQLRNVRVRRDQSILEGSVDFNLGTGELYVELEASGQRLGDLRWLGVPEVIEGRVGTANFAIEGIYTSPLIGGQAMIDDLQFREQVFDRANINVFHDGAVVSAEIQAGDQLMLELELDTFERGVPFQGTARFTNYDAALMTGMAPDTITATGIARFSADLRDFRTLEGSGEVTELIVRLSEDDQIVAPPFPFEFNDEEVMLSNVGLSGGTTSITVDGEVSLAPEAPIDLEILGELDLSLLYPRYVDFVTSGTLSLDGDVVGTLSNPQLDGRATLTDAGVSHPGVFLSLSGMNGELAFDGDSVTLINIEGAAGGGAVTVGGTIGIDGVRPGDLDLRIDASDVRLRTPEGFRTIFDAALSVGGTVEAPSMKGNVDVASLSFDESFEDFVAVFGEPLGGGLASDVGPWDGLTLALHVEGDQGIRIENELVRVEARLDLDIGGTLGQPSITGHVESLDGVVDLQGNRYLITRGNVDFVDPIGIEPRIDVQAETVLRDYRVILMLSGLANDVQIDMTSDPPLPQLEIISLMAGGRTREQLADDNGVGALPTSEELFQGAAAATLMNDLLAERVGSRFGLGSIVRIDPFLVGAENDPVARITISEQITRDLIVTYSQDLSSNRQEIILIEYFLDNNTSFIASRDETGAMGLDIRLRKRFR